MTKNLKELFVPNFSEKGKLTVMPLAPLSMVAGLSGSYYRTLRSPSKHMICGLLENLLDLHFDKKSRKQMLNALAKHLKKEFSYELDKSECEAASGFISLLYPFIELGVVKVPETLTYDDLWTQHLKHNDKRHVDGIRNTDHRIYGKVGNKIQFYNAEINASKTEEERKNIEKDLNQEILKLKVSELKGGKSPNFYQSPKRRQYIAFKGNGKSESIINSYSIPITTNPALLKAVQEAVKENNMAYLGNSEGWVHLEIEKK